MAFKSCGWFSLFYAATCAGGFILSLASPVLTQEPTSRAVIRDMSGRGLAVQPPAQRVVTLAPVLADYATIDGGAAHFLATARPNLNNPHELIWAQLYSSLLHLPLTGPTVDPGDPEIYLKLRPDAVFSWAYFSAPLRQIGLSSLIEMRFNGGDLQATREKLRLIGAVAGKSNRTELLIEQWNRQLQAVEQQINVAHLPVTRVAILNGSKDAWWIAGGKGFYLNGSLVFTGARNVAEVQTFEKNSNSTLENLLQLDPDVILLNTEPAEGAPIDLYSAPGYKALRAVRTRRVYVMPHTEDCELVDDPVRLDWMAEIFHPGAMTPTLRHLAKTTFLQTYNYELSNSQLDSILRIAENRGSAGYTRFERETEDRR
jgi:ABC-type Fe3+-hydroxamate transport system substrate-binding protein